MRVINYLDGTMAKRIIKDERIKEIIKNIAADFRFSQEMDDKAMMFYNAERTGVLRGKEIDDMIEYVETGLEELKNNIQWRQEFLGQNAEIGEMKMLENLKTIEEEYIDLLAFLKK
jgi:hypothetical protein